MEKHIYEDEDYKANYNKVVKALSTLKPLANRLNNFHKININHEKEELNKAFLEMIKHLTTTSRRYMLDIKVNMDIDEQKMVSVGVNESGIGYANFYSKHIDNLCDDVYYIDKIKALFKNKDAVLGISQLIKKENRVEFLKVVDLFNEFYSYINKALSEDSSQENKLIIELKNNNKLCIEFYNDNRLKYIYIESLNESNNKRSLFSSQDLLEVFYDEERNLDIPNTINNLKTTDIIILNNLILKQDEITNECKKILDTEKDLLVFVKKYKQLIDEKLKPLKAYEKL